jgi:hypothetical protein
MFKWDLSDPALQAMQDMSQGTAPERWLYEKGQTIAVMIGDDLHFLPAVGEGVNMYGQPQRWRVQPDAVNGYLYETLIGKTWTSEDSVVVRNASDRSADMPFMTTIARQLADCDLSINQMQLLAGTPVAFAVDESNVLTARNVYMAMAERVPAVFMSPYGQDSEPKVMDLGKRLDPAVFDVWDHWMSEGLSYLGIPTVEITKRAQQTVGEIESGTDKAMARRAEKLRMREWACERARKVFGVEMSVSLTEIGETEEVEEDDSDSAAGGDQEVAERGRRRVPERRAAFLRLAALPFPERDEGSHRGALRRDLRFPDDQRGDRGEVAGPA